MRERMAKNWRLVLCTRWRPLATLILMAGLFLGSIAFIWLLEKIGPGSANTPYKKAKALAVGMSEQDMIKIMGKRFSKETVNTDQLVNMYPDTTQEFENVRRNHARVIEYTFGEKRAFGSTGILMVSGIFLDEGDQKIVLLQPRPAMLDLIIAGEDERLLLLVSCIVLPLIGLSLWCKRQRAIRRATSN